MMDATMISAVVLMLQNRDAEAPVSTPATKDAAKTSPAIDNSTAENGLDAEPNAAAPRP